MRRTRPARLAPALKGNAGMRNEPAPPAAPDPAPPRTADPVWCNACGGRGTFAPGPGEDANHRSGAARRRSLFCDACGRIRPLWLRPRDALARLVAFGLISRPVTSPARTGGEARPEWAAFHREETVR